MSRSFFTVRVPVLALSVLAAAGGAAPLGAQDSVTTVAVSNSAPRSLAMLADSIAAFGDSTRALAMLDSAIRVNNRDATLWHRYGMISWEMARSKRSGGMMSDVKAIRQLSAADSALNLAAQLAPDSGRYSLDLARFYLNSGMAPTRFAAGRFSDNALKTARRVGDNRLVSEAATEQGLVYWRRFENTGYRALSRDGQPIQANLSGPGGGDRARARDFIESVVIAIDQDPEGTSDYRRALDLFREAVDADPDHVRARRNYYMALAELGKWEELREDAAERITTAPLDPVAWLAKGLAEHRLGNSSSAVPAFDSALVRLPDADRARLTSLTRVLRPKPGKDKNVVADSGAFSKLDKNDREALSRMYWMMADPLAITGANEHEAEFRARVAFAEIRWTQDDFGLKGADTDRGDIHIRYGPPDVQFNTVGNTSDYRAAGSTLTWVYNNGLVFMFDQATSFGTARVSFNDRVAVDVIKDAVPVSFDNVPVTRALDTIPARIARFRGGSDSTDIVVAARIPFDSLLKGMDVDRVPVDLDFRVLDKFVTVRGVQASRTSMTPDSARGIIRRYTTRIGDGTNVIRVEAYQPDSKHGARAVMQVPPEATSGFGLSDVLLSSRPAPREGVAAPTRWRDLDAPPSVGVYRVGDPIGLVWESYELEANNDGAARYDVNITIERLSPGGLAGFAARVLDGAGQAVGRTNRRGNNRITTSFSRTVPASSALLDYFTLDLGDISTGDYKLTVEINDKNGNKKASRTSGFTIVP